MPDSSEVNSMGMHAPAKTIRVVIADDHPMVRQGLRAVLEEASEVDMVAEAVDGLELLQQIELTHPDVVLVDVKMPGMGGLEAVRRIRRDHPEVKAVMLSGIGEDEVVQEALRAGASGYLLKTISSDELIRGIQMVATGRVLLQPASSAQDPLGAGHIHHDRSGNKAVSPSPREREVLKLMAQGQSNKEIARTLDIGAQTVKTHVSHILSKLGAPDRAGAVAIAFRRGLLD